MAYNSFMPAHINKTSFTLGHKRSPESIEKQRQTLRKQYADGIRSPISTGGWKPGQKEKHARTKRLKALGTRKIENGYWKIFTLKGYQYEHRVVMAFLLGRELLRNEIVHHKDGNKLNNNPINLDLTTPSNHAKIHYLEKLALTSYRRIVPAGKWSTKYDSCVNCGSSQNKYAGKGNCKICYDAKRRGKIIDLSL